MPSDPSIQYELIDVDRSVLIVIDLQETFLRKLSPNERSKRVPRIIWQVQVAQRLKIPLVVTAEDIAENGSVIPELREILQPKFPVHDKLTFNLAEEPEVLQAVKETQRRTAILVGLETDVCVAQSAIGLMGEGFQVVVVEDATAAPEADHQQGIRRLEGAGALVVSVKSLFYEWMRTVEAAREFLEVHEQDLGDSGFML